MRKNLILFLVFALLPRLVWSQYYISIDKENTFHYGNSYLINIPLNTIKGNLFVEDLNKSILVEGYFKLWKDRENYSFDSIFVAQKTVHEKQYGKNNAVIYQNDFNEYIIKYNRHPPYRKYIDTLNSIDPKLYKYKYLLPKVLKNKKDSVLIYYTEFYGSSCCPRDPKRDRISEDDFIRLFEKKYSVKIGKIYSNSFGEEGEVNNYFTLSGLTPEQKIQFIDERIESLYGDNNQKLKEYQSLIYTPRWMSVKDLIPPKQGIEKQPKIDYNQTFASPDIYPSFPNGYNAFRALFNGIEFRADTSCVITFIVKKNGALTDLKILRGGSDQINHKIYAVIIKSPKWNAGTKNGRKVDAYYTLKLSQVESK